MVEGARLESVFRLIPNEGSNPSLSAIFHKFIYRLEKSPKFLDFCIFIKVFNDYADLLSRRVESCKSL